MFHDVQSRDRICAGERAGRTPDPNKGDLNKPRAIWGEADSFLLDSAPDERAVRYKATPAFSSPSNVSQIAFGSECT